MSFLALLAVTSTASAQTATPMEGRLSLSNKDTTSGYVHPTMSGIASDYYGRVWYGRHEPIPGDRSGATRFVKYGDPVVDGVLEQSPYEYLNEIGFLEANFEVTAPNIHSFAEVNYTGGGGYEYVQDRWVRWNGHEVVQ